MPWSWAVCWGVGFLLQTWALTSTDALTSGFLTGLLVVIAPLAGWLLYRERLGRATAVGVGLAATGVLVLGLRSTGLGAGELVTMASATVWGLHLVLLSRWSAPGHALRLARAQAATVTGLGLLVLLVRPVATGGSPLPVLPPDAAAWGSVLFLAVLASAVAMALLSWAQSRVRATRAAVILTLEPAVAGITAALAGTALTGRTVLGALLLLAAMYVVELSSRAPTGRLGSAGVRDRAHRGDIVALVRLLGRQHRAEQPVEVGGRLLGRQVADQRDGLGDRHLVRGVAVVDLVDGDPGGGAVDPRHPLEGPAATHAGGDPSVDLPAVPDHAADEVGGVVADRRVGEVGPDVQGRDRVLTAQVGLEQDVEGPLAGLAPRRQVGADAVWCGLVGCGLVGCGLVGCGHRQPTRPR